MTLHIGGYVKQTTHEVTSCHIITHPCLVVEEYFYQSLRVCVFLFVDLFFLIACAFAHLFHDAIPGLVQVILKAFTHVIVYLCRGVCGCQFFTFRYHREDTTEDCCAACINLHVFVLENLWEVLGHTFADTVMLALTDSCQVAKTFDSGREEGFQFLQRFFTNWCQLASHAGIFQGVDG